MTEPWVQETLPLDPERPPVDPAAVEPGPPISPSVRIRTYDAGEWEEFVEEWAHYLRVEYAHVERLAGAGDMGRDVVATTHDGLWDNFQCKHYDHPLQPSEIWVELGKVMFYTLRGDYTVPRAYRFAAPHGVGTSLSGLLRRPDLLRQKLVDNWATKCRVGVTKTGPVELDDSMGAYIEQFDFAIFGHVPPLTLIDGHRETPYFVSRFGGGLPMRAAAPDPPEDVDQEEAVYVDALLRAYAERSRSENFSLKALRTDRGLRRLLDHFNDARREFYSAEALRSFSRDALPPGEFSRLQDIVRAGVVDVARDDHDDAYRCVLAVVRAAKLLPLETHPLRMRVFPLDRGGICHQLVNDDRLSWWM